MAREKSKSAGYSPLLSVPTEVRLLIYEYLLDDGGNQWLAIRSRADSEKHKQSCSCRMRSRYLVLDQTIHRRCYETTYQLATPAAAFDTAIMRTSRRIYAETSYMLYGLHGFDFGGDLAAVVPFLRDRSAHSRQLLRAVALHKQAPVPTREHDQREWANLCRYLGVAAPAAELKLRLRLVIEGGGPLDMLQPPSGGEDGGAGENSSGSGVGQRQALSPAALSGLLREGHEGLEWVGELARAQGVFEGLEVVLRDRYSRPRTENTKLIGAFPGWVDRAGMEDFLGAVLGIETN